MEEFFDLREFIVMIFKKSKLIIIAAVAFLVLGVAYGYLTVSPDKFTTTSSTSVNILQAKATDATALTNVMTSIKDTVAGDYFYTGVLNSLKQSVDNDEFNQIFAGNKQPAISELKKIIKIYVNGNLVLVDVTTTDEALSVEASQVARTYVTQQLQKNINNIDLKEQGSQTVNASLQSGDTTKSRVLKFGVLGLGGGIVLSALFVFFVNVMSLKVKSANDLKKYHLPVFEEYAKGGK